MKKRLKKIGQGLLDAAVSAAAILALFPIFKITPKKKLH